MKKVLFTLIGTLLLGLQVHAADIQASLTWDGKDISGNLEQSLPVTFNLYNADTLDLLSTATADGPVTDFPLPQFSYTPPANQIVVLNIQAQAVDAAGNKSGYSNIVSIPLIGDDTNPPLNPIINIIINN